MSLSDFSSYLIPGEKLVWTGRPAQGLRFYGRDVLLIPFSLMWGGFAIFWEFSVWSMPNSPAVAKIWGIPFVLVGMYLIFGRFFVDAWARKRIRYAVTNKRVLINRLGPFSKFAALSLENLPEASIIVGQNGRGDIEFAAKGNNEWQRQMFTPSLASVPQFIGIENVQDVFKKIQVAADQSKKADHTPA